MKNKITLQHDPVIEYTVFPRGTFTNGTPVKGPLSGLFTLLSRFDYTPETMAEYRAGTDEQRKIWKNTGGIVPALFTNNYRNGENYLSGFAVMLDIEKIHEHTGVKVTQAEADEAIRKLPYCTACYSSHSNSDEDPRRRVCIPTSRPMSDREAALVTREVGRRLNIEWCDPGAFDPPHLMYLPSCSKDAAPVFWYKDGPAVDVDEILQRYTILYGDWQNTKYWPKPSHEKYISGDKTLTDPTEKPGWIGAYNRVYDVERAMDEEIPGVYEETINPLRRKYSGSSSADGAKICADFCPGSFLCSFHGSDPATGVHHSFDLVRIHKYGHLDEGLPDDMPMQDRPSQKAMIEHCQTLPEVVAEWAKENAVGANEFNGLNPTEVRIRLCNMLKELRPEQNERYGRHDAGNGNLFADMSNKLLCFVPERKKWYHYDGIRWIPDTENNAYTMNHCKNIADALMSYTISEAQFPDEEKKAQYLKHVLKWQGFKYRETILKEAATVLSINYSASDFDGNPYLFNCLNGTLDLHTGDFREHNSAYMITKLAEVEYQPEARCERWEQFIREITCEDSALAQYIQKCLGYSLTGDTRHECFFILYGATSRNGKGTLCETFMRLVGDYGRTANPETIAMRKNADSRSASGDVARLAGARFVNISEPDKSMTISAQLVKTLTGNDTITARNLYEREYEYKAQFKMFIGTNHLPYITDQTLFSSDRIKVIPFNRHFTEAERDPELKRKLTAPESLSGILNWCLYGLRMLNHSGFGEPVAVREATRDYRDSSDKIGQFIEEMLMPGQGAKVNAKEVHNRYQDWCYNNGYNHPEGFTEFRKSLASANIQIRRERLDGSKNKAQVIHGYSLQ